MDPEIERLRRFMSGRLSVASSDELVEAGFTRSRIKNWVRNGRLVPLFREVYSYGRDVDTRDAAFRAGLLVAGPGSALTGRSALQVWGAVDGQSTIPPVLVVATESDRRFTHRGLSPKLHGSQVRVVRRRFEPGDIRRKNGLSLIRVTTALMEFAIDASEREVRFAFLEACRLKQFGRPDVSRSFERMSGRRGARKLKPLLAAWVPQLNRIRSVLEGLFLLAWIERGLELPLVNSKTFGYEVDPEAVVDRIEALIPHRRG